MENSLKFAGTQNVLRKRGSFLQTVCGHPQGDARGLGRGQKPDFLVDIVMDDPLLGLSVLFHVSQTLSMGNAEV